MLTPMMASAMLPITAADNDSAMASTGEEIDVYFIAGQSNAGGCSFCNTITDPKPEYTTGYENVLYLGCALNNHSETGVIVTEPIPVQLGLGMDANHFGSEVGIAEYLSQYYNTNSGKKAVIIKYGVNSASFDGSYSAQWGSWLAPSLIGNGYEIFDGGVNFYDKLLQTLQSGITTLNNAGYTKLNYKGFYWSQGESETSSNERAQSYGTLLSAFIQDFRNDLFAITGNSEDLLLPFLISEICPSFSENTAMPDGSSSSESINILVAKQREVADTLENVKTLNTAVYTIKNGENGVRDIWHYGGDDMINIGNRVGATLYARGVNATVTDGNLTPDGCSINVLGNADGTVTVTWQVPENYTVEAILLNGTNIQGSVTGNSYTVSKEDADLLATFTVQLLRNSYKVTVPVLQSKLKLVIENADGSALVYDPQNPKLIKFDEGTTVRFKLYTERAGYFPSCVKCNGVELQKNDEGFYTFTITEDSALEIRHTRVQTLSVDLQIMLFNPKNPLG